MKITKRQLRKMIRGVLTESRINEGWIPSEEGELPRNFREPTDMKILSIENIDNPVDPRTRSVKITAEKDGVSFDSEFQFYEKDTSGDKQARMAYEKAVASLREKFGEDK